MENKNSIENFEEENRLTIRNQTFKNKIDQNQYIECDALARIIFVNCRFEELDLPGKVFGSCDFKHCKFNHLNFRKCHFSNCKFENCQIVNSAITRAEFYSISFKNSQFIKSDFDRCEFIETTFKNSNLDFILAQDIKCWKLNQLIKIKNFSSFANILKDISLASWDEG